ncbi:MAG: EpsG family protein [Burkholderiales bacterium]|nr:EpsG family protein [Burkholderiales bacterium]
MLIYVMFYVSILCCYAYSSRDKQMEQILLICLCVLLALFAGMRAIDVSADGANYAYMFDSVYQYSDWFTSRNELMAVVIPVTLKYLGLYSYFSAFLVFAIFGVGLKFLAIKKYSPLPLLSVLLYYSSFFILHEMTQIRAGVATGILLLTLNDIYEKNFLKFLIKIFIASMFHISSLVFLLAYFINSKSINKKIYLVGLFIFVPLGALKLINIFGLIPGLSGFSTKLATYEALQNGMTEVNLFNITTTINLFILIIQLIFIEKITVVSKYSVIIIKLMYFGIVSLFIFSAIPVIAWRISELFMVISFISVTYFYYIIRPRFISLSVLVLFSFLMLSLNLFRQGLLQPYHTLFS